MRIPPLNPRALFRISRVTALVWLGMASVALAQNYPTGVQDVVKLSQAGISEDIILSQIRNNQASYNLSADQIIALKDDGVSARVINALIGGTSPTVPTSAPPAPAAPPPPAAPAPVSGEPSASAADTYQTQLAGAGAWVEVPGLGQCWQPTVATVDLSWRPYCDHGHWLYTDAGWSWSSDYAWGNVVFHYGRWTRFNNQWVWVPGYDYAPAWVCWREADGYCGWAPLPPAAVYRPGLGLYYHGAAAVDVDFGLAMAVFTFVGYDHFWDLDYRACRLAPDQVELVFHGSHVMNGYRINGGHLVVEGLGHEHIALVTHHEIQAVHETHDDRESRPVRDLRDSRENRDNHRDRNIPGDRRAW
ncbi:MAG TPA: DUF6600 domain-containing protein [Verrucomicrobiae bacterium]